MICKQIKFFIFVKSFPGKTETGYKRINIIFQKERTFINNYFL